MICKNSSRFSTLELQTTKRKPSLNLKLASFKMVFLSFLLAYFNCTKGFHCDISMYAYNVL
jgi:hypothetical protein